MCFAGTKKKGAHAGGFFISDDCHPQTIAVVKTRATALGVNLIVGKPETFDFKANEVRFFYTTGGALAIIILHHRRRRRRHWASYPACSMARIPWLSGLGGVCFICPQVVGAIVQYPTTDGRVVDYGDFVKRAHEHGVAVACGTDLLALALLKPPGRAPMLPAASCDLRVRVRVCVCARAR
jgi:glycine dehydrogenase